MELPLVDLSNANLSGSRMVFCCQLLGDDTNLINTNLSKADLSGAFISQQQLDQVYSCKGAILPKGLICHHNQ
jgi:uncharacterized protein YjbI with pentapeptide repeats